MESPRISESMPEIYAILKEENSLTPLLPRKVKPSRKSNPFLV